MKKAITVADLVYARSATFKKRLDRAKQAIEEAGAIGKIGISYSSGKDSTCIAHLIREFYPDAPIAFYDSGYDTEYDETYTLVEQIGAVTYPSEISLVDLCKDYGYWGHEPRVRLAKVDFFAFLVDNPAIRFSRDHNIEVMGLGLRGGENYGRLMSYLKRGELYPIDSHVAQNSPLTHHLCPLGSWKDDDVWAYIASNDLPYNPIYDGYAQINAPRRDWRVSMLLGSTYATYGRYAYLRKLAPQKFNVLLAHFPKLDAYL